MSMFINKKQIVLISIIIAMIAGFFFLQYLPTMARIKESKELEMQRQAQQAKVDSDLHKLPDLMKKMESFKADIGDFDKRIPLERDYGVFLQDVTMLMQKYALEDQVVMPSDEKKYAELNCIPVTVECTGKLEQVFNFFKDVETSQRLFRIEQIRFENKEYNGSVKVYAKGSIFYRQGM